MDSDHEQSDHEQSKLSLHVLPHSGKVDQMKTAPLAISPTPSYVAHVNRTKPPGKLSPVQQALEEKIIEQLRSVFDPEIPLNIYELGLIYDIDIDPENRVHIRMTLTAPACPVAGSLPPQVEAQVESIPQVKSATVELVWDPPWSRDMLSEAARLQLGL
jgi:FeS assembly SUF system protein